MVKEIVQSPKKLSPPSLRHAIFSLIAIIGVLIFSEILVQWTKQRGWTNFDISKTKLIGSSGYDSIPGPNLIRAMAFDANGQLWIGAADGVFKLSKNADGNTSISKSIFSGGNVNALAFDNQNQMWVGTDVALEVLTPQGKWETVLNEIIFALATDQQGKIWVEKKYGLSVFFKGKWTDFSEPSRHRSRLAVDQKGQLWRADSNQIDILSANGSWIKYTAIGDFDNIAGTNSLAFDNAGGVWVGIFDRLFVCNHGKCNQYNASNSGLGGDRVDNLVFDGENRLWISTDHTLHILNTNQVLSASLLDGLMIIHWLENIVLFALVYLFVVRQLPEKSDKLTGALGGGMAAILVGDLLISTNLLIFILSSSSLSLYTFVFILTLVGLVIGSIVGNSARNSGNRKIIYLRSAVTIIALFGIVFLLFIFLIYSYQ